MELHLRDCPHCAEALGDLSAAAAAYERGFERLRLRRTALAPGRARLAAVEPQRATRGMDRWFGMRRLAELSAISGVMALVIVGSMKLEPTVETVPPTSVITSAPAPGPLSDEEMLGRSRLRSQAAIRNAGLEQVVPPAASVRN